MTTRPNAARTAYERRRRQGHAAGTWLGQQPVAVIAEHLDKLVDVGHTHQMIADRAGVASSTVRAIRRRKLPTVKAGTARALLALPVVSATPPMRRGTRLPIGTIRRMRALVAIGYPVTWQAVALGRTSVQFDQIIHGEHAFITDALAEDIDGLYKRWSETPTEASRATNTARNSARRRGWAPPRAWDSTTIDDPSAEPWSWLAAYDDMPTDGPDDVAVEEVVTTRRPWTSLDRDVDRREVVRVLAGRGLGAQRIASYVGTSKAVIEPILRAIRRDVAA